MIDNVVVVVVKYTAAGAGMLGASTVGGGGVGGGLNHFFAAKKIYWAVESLSTMRYEKMAFESNSYLAGEAVLNPKNFRHLSGLIGSTREKLSLLRLWSIAYVHKEANRCADAIALSVTRDHRYTSYIVKDGPGWLLPIILEDAPTV